MLIIIKKCFFIFILFSFSFATRIDISFEKMKEVNSNNFYYFNKIILANAKHTYFTKHFKIFWGDTNPATTLWADYNKDKIPDFITDTASILENVWNIEINKFGFKAVEYPVNVYISNTGMYLNGYPLNLSLIHI
jgi:hypothetical protein